MLQKLKELIDEKGQGIVEYGLILAFVAIIAIAIFANDGLSQSVKDSFDNANDVVTKINDAADADDFEPGTT